MCDGSPDAPDDADDPKGREDDDDDDDADDADAAELTACVLPLPVAPTKADPTAPSRPAPSGFTGICLMADAPTAEVDAAETAAAPCIDGDKNEEAPAALPAAATAVVLFAATDALNALACAAAVSTKGTENSERYRTASPVDEDEDEDEDEVDAEEGDDCDEAINEDCAENGAKASPNSPNEGVRKLAPPPDGNCMCLCICICMDMDGWPVAP
jgi:hypothetical protein